MLLAMGGGEVAPHLEYGGSGGQQMGKGTRGIPSPWKPGRQGSSQVDSSQAWPGNKKQDLGLSFQKQKHFLVFCFC